MTGFDGEVPASVERQETLYNSFILGYPAGRYDEARRVYMDSTPSMETFSSVLGALAITAEKRRVIAEVGDTRLDFARIVEDLDKIK